MSQSGVGCFLAQLKNLKLAERRQLLQACVGYLCGDERKVLKMAQLGDSPHVVVSDSGAQKRKRFQIRQGRQLSESRAGYGRTGKVKRIEILQLREFSE